MVVSLHDVILIWSVSEQFELDKDEGNKVWEGSMVPAKMGCPSASFAYKICIIFYSRLCRTH
jgi:hypothetical protein